MWFHIKEKIDCYKTHPPMVTGIISHKHKRHLLSSQTIRPWQLSTSTKI